MTFLRGREGEMMHIPTSCRHYGGGKRIRTADPLLAMQVLSQLSYSPITAATRTTVSGLIRARI